MTSIDLDEFQKEINQAEYYLQFGSSNVNAPINTHDENNDTTVSGPNNKNLSSAITSGLDDDDAGVDLRLQSEVPSRRNNKYSDAAERESLVNRLLREHQLKSTATIGNSRHYFDDDEKDVDRREPWSMRGDIDVDEEESGSSPQVDDDLDDNIIFYASDLQQPMLTTDSALDAIDPLAKRGPVDRSQSLLFFGGIDNHLYPTGRSNSNPYPIVDPDEYNQLSSFMETTRFDNSNLNAPFAEPVYRDKDSYQRTINRTVNPDDDDYDDPEDALGRDTAGSTNSKSTDSLEFATTQAWPQPSYSFSQELLGTAGNSYSLSRQYDDDGDNDDTRSVSKQQRQGGYSSMGRNIGRSRGRTDRRVSQSSLRSRVYSSTQSSRSRSTSRDKPRATAIPVSINHDGERRRGVGSGASPMKNTRHNDDDKRHRSASRNSRNSSSKYLLSRGDLQQSAERQFVDSHTFRPNVVPLRDKSAHRSATPTTTSHRSTTPDSFMRRIDEFSREKERQRRDWLKQKKLLDDMAMAECTFTPELSKGTHNILKNRSQSVEMEDRVSVRKASESSKDPLKTSDRLYREAEKRVSQQRFIEKQVYDARMAQYTFQPNLNPHSSRTSSDYEEVERVLPSKPIHERLSDMLREKKRYMQELQAVVQSEEEQELTFQPKIDKNSKSIAERKLLGYNESTIAHRNIPSSSSSSLQRDNSESARHSMRGAGSATALTKASSDGNNIINNNNNNYQANNNIINNNNYKANNNIKLTREQESAIILGLHRDVGSRLLDQGRVISRHKQELLYERDNEIAESLERAKISKGSAKIMQRTGLDSASFEDRLQHYRQKEKRKEDVRHTQEMEQVKDWFRPSICEQSGKIIQEQRPDLLLETNEMRIHRLSLQSAEEIKERRRLKAAELYGSLTFTPKIDGLSKVLGKSNSIDELVYNTRGQHIKDSISRKVEADKYRECTFQPRINELSKQLLSVDALGEDDRFIQRYYEEYSQVRGYNEAVADACPVNEMERYSGLSREHLSRLHHGRINMKEPERMAHDIRVHLIEKEEKRRSELIAQEINDLRECTFRPNLDNSYSFSSRALSQHHQQQPVVIKGLNRHLELRYMSVKQREDALAREREVFSVRNVDKYRRAEDGSTIVEPFHFNESSSPKNPHTDTADQHLSRATYKSRSSSSVDGLDRSTTRRHTSNLDAPIWAL